VHEQNTRLHAANQEIGVRNQQLAHSNQDLDNFVYAASHDLKQPVNNLVGLFAELRRTATFHDEDEALVLHLFDESLGILSTTIHDLAAVVQEQRHPSGQLTELVTFAELAAEAQLALRPELLATQAQLTFEFGALPALPYVRSTLRTVLFNLLSNSLKYGDELFQLFRRFHPEASEGTGVGLFLVNRLVEGGGGHIKVDSQPGLGTTFRVHLRNELAYYPSH
jgi:signal transduction histidine kinase